MALCRKVFAKVYHMLDENEYHYFRDKKLHDKKMDDYYKFLDANGIRFKKSV